MSAPPYMQQPYPQQYPPQYAQGGGDPAQNYGGGYPQQGYPQQGYPQQGGYPAPYPQQQPQVVYVESGHRNQGGNGADKCCLYALLGCCAGCCIADCCD